MSMLPAAMAVFTSRPESNCFQSILTPISFSCHPLALAIISLLGITW